MIKSYTAFISKEIILLSQHTAYFVLIYKNNQLIEFQKIEIRMAIE